MAKAKRVELHGVEGVGATVTEAKADAGRKLDTLVARMKDGPSVFHVHGLVAVIWPDENGWSFRVDDPRKPPEMHGEMWGTSSGDRTRAAATISALNHLGQNAWTHGQSEDWMFVVHTFEQCPRWIDRAEIRRAEHELARWIGWQRDYKRLRNLGATDGEAHRHAGHHDGFDDLLRARLREAA